MKRYYWKYLISIIDKHSQENSGSPLAYLWHSLNSDLAIKNMEEIIERDKTM